MRRNIKNGERTELMAEKEFEIRFSEIDSMNIVWHGSYSLYFEDAREAFGKKYGLGYTDIFTNGYYAPLVELSFSYKAPLLYGMKCVIRIFYRKTEAAKLIFDYEIYNAEDYVGAGFTALTEKGFRIPKGKLLAEGRSVQVFMDKKYNMLWTNPDFYEAWKARWV